MEYINFVGYVELTLVGAVQVCRGSLDAGVCHKENTYSLGAVFFRVCMAAFSAALN